MNNGVPVSLVALNANRGYLVNHLMLHRKQTTRNGNAINSSMSHSAAFQAHAKLMKDLNRQSVDKMKNVLLAEESDERKTSLRKEYISRQPYASAAVYGYRCLPRISRERLKDEFKVMLDEKVRLR